MRTKEEVLEFVRFRLGDSNPDTKIFDDKILNQFFYAALSEFNAIPPFTSIVFDKDDVDICVLAAPYIAKLIIIYALASQALTERGREFSINDSVSFEPPNISELLMSQYYKEYETFFHNITELKTKLNNKIYSLRNAE